MTECNISIKCEADIWINNAPFDPNFSIRALNLDDYNPDNGAGHTQIELGLSFDDPIDFGYATCERKTTGIYTELSNNKDDHEATIRTKNVNVLGYVLAGFNGHCENGRLWLQNAYGMSERRLKKFWKLCEKLSAQWVAKLTPEYPLLRNYKIDVFVIDDVNLTDAYANVYESGDMIVSTAIESEPEKRISNIILHEITHFCLEWNDANFNHSKPFYDIYNRHELAGKKWR